MFVRAFSSCKRYSHCLPRIHIFGEYFESGIRSCEQTRRQSDYRPCRCFLFINNTSLKFSCWALSLMVTCHHTPKSLRDNLSSQNAPFKSLPWFDSSLEAFFSRLVVQENLALMPFFEYTGFYDFLSASGIREDQAWTTRAARGDATSTRGRTTAAQRANVR